jgi:hypothetical protein
MLCPVVTARCSTPGAILETFTFEGADVKTSSNVHSIEVMFSPTGPSNSPAGPNNGLNACHFIYSSGVVYLAGSSGGTGSLWTAGNSILGQGGTVLDNGICRIHANTSSYSLTQDPYILNVTLSLDFYNLATSYIYVVVENNQLLFSNGDTWAYFGSWSN